MKRWITMLSAGLMALSLSTASLAQQAAPGAKARPGAAQQGRRGGALRGLDQALKSLNLTAEQKPKVEAALKTARDEMKKIRESQGTPQERRPKMQATMKNLQAKLDTILNAEQKKQLKEKMAQARQARQTRRNSAGAPPASKK